MPRSRSEPHPKSIAAIGFGPGDGRTSEKKGATLRHPKRLAVHLPRVARNSGDRQCSRQSGRLDEPIAVLLEAPLPGRRGPSIGPIVFCTRQLVLRFESILLGVQTARDGRTEPHSG